MNIADIEHVSVSYGEKHLFQDVSLGINSGDKIGLIGVNGTGKSTFLKVVAGILTPDEGRVIKGRSITFSYLPQTPDFSGQETAMDAVRCGRKLDETEAAEARALLSRFGIQDPGMKLLSMSGGERKRVALASVLLQKSEVLILDEPTNHLDLQMIQYLEDDLRRFRGELLLVTHDRYFLDRVTNRIAELDRGSLYLYEGGYEKYLERYAERMEEEVSAQKKREKLLRTELAWIRRGARARATKQQARIGRFEDLKNETRLAREKLSKDSLSIGSVSTRLGKKTIEVRNLSKSYGEKVLIRDFSYIFLRDDRIGIIGQNGCGKSTLMDLIAGELWMDAGEIERGETVRIGYFRQHSVFPDENLKVLDYIRSIGEYVRTESGLITASQMCDRFLFSLKMQKEKISSLSGGEKRRLYLLSVLISQPNVLILDEPTNDLDIETLEILEDYLDHFLGIVITVSHDRYFLDRVVSRIFAFEGEGVVRQFEGTFTDYADRKAAEESALSQDARKDGLKGIDQGEDKKGKVSVHKLRMTFKEAREFEGIDQEIHSLEEKIRSLDGEMELCGSDYVRLTVLSEEKERAEKALEEKEERWLYLQELQERIEAQD